MPQQVELVGAQHLPKDHSRPFPDRIPPPTSRPQAGFPLPPPAFPLGKSPQGSPRQSRCTPLLCRLKHGGQFHIGNISCHRALQQSVPIAHEVCGLTGRILFGMNSRSNQNRDQNPGQRPGLGSGMLLAGNGLGHIGFTVVVPPEPKVESSTLSSRTSLRSPLRSELQLAGQPSENRSNQTTKSEGCRAVAEGEGGLKRPNQ